MLLIPNLFQLIYLCCVCWWKKQRLLGQLTQSKNYWKNIIFCAKTVVPYFTYFFGVIFRFSIPKYTFFLNTRWKDSKEKVIRWASLLESLYSKSFRWPHRKQSNGLSKEPIQSQSSVLIISIALCCAFERIIFQQCKRYPKISERLKD